MAGIVTVNIKGLAELQKKLEQELPKDARLALRVALNAGAGDFKNAMVAAAPVESEGENSGFLRDHIKTKVTLRRNDLAGTALVGPTTDAYPGREGKQGHVEFRTVTGKKISFDSKHAGAVTASRVARFLEFGTSKMSQHAFMTPAFESSKESALSHIIAKIKEALKIS
jgi:HK97 gp10 family phage protein